METETAISSDLARLLMDVAFVGIGNGQLTNSRTILDGLSKARPESEMPWIVKAISFIHQNKPNDAIKMLEKALALNGDSYLAKAHLGLAYKMAGFGTRSDSVLKEVIDSDADKESKAFASKVLADKYTP